MRKRKLLFQICLAVLLVSITWVGLFPAIASAQLESRLNALESDINGLESRLNQIEAQLNQIRSSQFPRLPSTPPLPSTSGGRRSPLNREQMFDRLATLVIELKEQITKLETRVSKLELR